MSMILSFYGGVVRSYGANLIDNNVNDAKPALTVIKENGATAIEAQGAIALKNYLDDFELLFRSQGDGDQATIESTDPAWAGHKIYFDLGIQPGVGFVGAGGLHRYTYPGDNVGTWIWNKGHVANVSTTGTLVTTNLPPAPVGSVFTSAIFNFYSIIVVNSFTAGATIALFLNYLDPSGNPHTRVYSVMNVVTNAESVFGIVYYLSPVGSSFNMTATVTGAVNFDLFYSTEIVQFF